MKVTIAAFCSTLLLASAVSAQGIRPTERPPASQPTSRPASQPASRPADLAATGFARRVENAHGAANWPAGKALRCDITVQFGGDTMLEGTMTFEHPGGRCRVETADATAVWDGARAWVTPKREALSMARFHLLTWPYFIVAPFKLRDPGCHLAGTGLKSMNGGLSETARLTFDAGVGDTPDDWYMVYLDPRNTRLLALAYIVTYGTSKEDAEKDPHVAVYRDYARIDDVHLPTMITFHGWDEQRGAHEEKIGEARLSGLEFVTADDDAFARPEDSVEAPGP